MWDLIKIYQYVGKLGMVIALDLIKIGRTSAICLEEQFPGIRDSQETDNTITT